MSQPNTTEFTFNISEPYYGSEPSQSFSNPSFSQQQWSQQGQGSRSVGHGAPSPSPSVRTTWSAPTNSRPSNAMGYSQPNVMRRDNRIDPSLDPIYLQVPQGSRPRTSLENANPIERFYSEDAPWSTERMRSSPFDRASFSQPSVHYRYREGPGSEIESLVPRSDSGYQTQSLISHEPDRVEPELPYQVTNHIENMHVSSAASEPADVFGASSITDQASVYSGRSTARSAGGKEIRCPECKEVSKCKSDHKKHMLRHNKPFKCLIQGCRRGGRGFTTVNDLNRHKKSVHRIGALDNSYQCASENCRNKEKIWPRLDNFKQHIHRMHKDEDEQELIRRSVYRPPEATPSAEPSLSVAPMDTTLAGIGTERQFSTSSNELDDPVSGISLTPDQESNQWTSFDPSTHEFAVELDQPNANMFGQVPKRPSSNAGYRQQHQAPVPASTTTSTLARRDSFRLDTLADAAISQTTSTKPAQRPPPKLSSAPQTKADQQRQALQKLSKVIVRDIQNATSNEPEDLENVIARVLSTTIGRKDIFSSTQTLPQLPNRNPSASQNISDSTGVEALTKQDTRAMSDLLKKAPASRPRRTSSFSANMKKCEHCPVTVARACDMRKHMKRHTRPYGCTYPKCHKRFGAKSDWKRHENSQHFQLESFRCQLPSPASQTPCGELFYRPKIFESHLLDEHKMTDPKQIDHEIKMRRIGKNGQGQFWCGFCERIVRLERKRNAAWDERFDHIDNHFNKEGRRIEEWLCVEARKTKGEVLKETDKDSFDEDDTEDMSPEGEQGSPDGVQQDLAPSSSNVSPNKRKRAVNADAEEDVPVPKRNKRELFKYCCTCESGPWATHTFLNCMECEHQWCGNCTTAISMVQQQ